MRILYGNYTLEHGCSHTVLRPAPPLRRHIFKILSDAPGKVKDLISRPANVIAHWRI